MTANWTAGFIELELQGVGDEEDTVVLQRSEVEVIAAANDERLKTEAIITRAK